MNSKESFIRKRIYPQTPLAYEEELVLKSQESKKLFQLNIIETMIIYEALKIP